MRLTFFYLLLLLSLLYSCHPPRGRQEESNDQEQLGEETKTRFKRRTYREEFKTDTMPILDNADTIQKFLMNQKKKKKKPKKRVFYGYKCGKGFTKKGVGATQSYEIFYFLKKYHAPPEYAKEIYVYDGRKAEIVKLSAIDPKELPFYRILHGPYKKYQGMNVVEEGIYFIGTKHGRWETYRFNKKDTTNYLVTKFKYYKGFPKESKITYYDESNQSKVKEVIPYMNGDMTGTYYYFKENGDPLMHGEYKEGQKAGIWHEYFEDKNRKKREVQYPKDPRLDHFEPYIIREWDEHGTVIIIDGKPAEEARHKGGAPPSSKQKKTKPVAQPKSTRPPSSKAKPISKPVAQPDSTGAHTQQPGDTTTAPATQVKPVSPQTKSSRPPASHRPVAPAVQPKSTRPPVSKKQPGN